MEGAVFAAHQIFGVAEDARADVSKNAGVSVLSMLRVSQKLAPMGIIPVIFAAFTGIDRDPALTVVVANAALSIAGNNEEAACG